LNRTANECNIGLYDSYIRYAIRHFRSSIDSRPYQILLEFLSLDEDNQLSIEASGSNYHGIEFIRSCFKESSVLKLIHIYNVLSRNDIFSGTNFIYTLLHAIFEADGYFLELRACPETDLDRFYLTMLEGNITEGHPVWEALNHERDVECLAFPFPKFFLDLQTPRMNRELWEIRMLSDTYGEWFEQHNAQGVLA